MERKEIKKTEINTATKWSFISEVASKLVSPVTNMVLARLLTPDAFGIVATVVMIISLADIFSTAGLSKYILQHDFKSNEEIKHAANIAFSLNIGLSCLFCIFIFLLKDQIAFFTGCEGYGVAVATGAITLPMTAFSSIQMALFQKKMQYRALFFARLVGILTPLFVTIPLAFITRSYWAMIIGNITVALLNAIILTIKSSWKPQIAKSFQGIKEMISFCGWAFLEQFLGWANLNIGIFIVSTVLSTYYLGLYKTSMAVVNQIMAIFTITLSSIVLATLSNCIAVNGNFKEKYYYFQKMLAMVLLPIGFGIFIFHDTITLIILGSQWTEVSLFVGLWGLMTAVEYTIASFSIETFIAIGKPKFGVVFQIITCIISVPVLYYTAHLGFGTLCIARSLLRIVSASIQIILLKMFVSISFVETLKNLKTIFVPAFAMAGFALVVKAFASSLIIDVINIMACIGVYMIIFAIISSDNKVLLFDLLHDFGIKRKQ